MNRLTETALCLTEAIQNKTNDVKISFVVVAGVRFKSQLVGIYEQVDVQLCPAVRKKPILKTGSKVYFTFGQRRHRSSQDCLFACLSRAGLRISGGHVALTRINVCARTSHLNFNFMKFAVEGFSRSISQ